MKFFKNILVALLLVISSGTFAQAPKNVDNPKLLAVKFHADWCRVCRAMGPAFEDLENKLDGSKVLFVKLDFTNNLTKAQANMLGEELGIAPVMNNYKRKTGFILLIDPNSKKVLDKLTVNDDLNAMEAKVRALL